MQIFRETERERERERKENVGSHQLRYPTGNACKKESAFTIAQFFFLFYFFACRDFCLVNCHQAALFRG
jgi:hypothetical protein